MKNTVDIELQEVPRLRVLVAGNAGTGKSIFAASCPSPGFIFDFDGGILSYRGKAFDYETFANNNNGWLSFEKTLSEVKKILKADPTRYQSIIVDSTTAMTAVAMERAMHLDKSRSLTGGPKWEVHYAIVKNLIEGFTRQILEFTDPITYPGTNLNVIFIAHVRLKENEAGGIIGSEIALTGQLAAHYPNLFDEIWFTSVRPTLKDEPASYVMQTVNQGLFAGRSRLAGKDYLLPKFVPNDYNEVIKIYQANLKAKQLNEGKKNV